MRFVQYFVNTMIIDHIGLCIARQAEPLESVHINNQESDILLIFLFAVTAWTEALAKDADKQWTMVSGWGKLSDQKMKDVLGHRNSCLSDAKYMTRLYVYSYLVTYNHHHKILPEHFYIYMIVTLCILEFTSFYLHLYSASNYLHLSS